jgi:alcohol dehydrogenase
MFGKGQLDDLHKQSLPGKKALIITTAGKSVIKYGYLKRLQDQLAMLNIRYIVFDKILPNPIKEHVMEAADIAKKEACDFVIGLGGGSSIDSAKSIAVMAKNPGDYWDYIHGGTGKGMPVAIDPLPVVAITTTAGTGTEADPWTVITNGNEKIGFGYDKTFPVLSITDPSLMMTVPKTLTAYQGFDALFHSAEGFINKNANIMSDMYALKAIELIGRSLATAVNDGSNEQAREEVALANMLAGMVEAISSCTSEHSLGHALSAFHTELAHGATLIMISKEYFSFFANAGACNDKMVEMAKALGNKDASKPMDFVDALYALQKACGVDDLKMSDYGVAQNDWKKYTENARQTMGGLYAGDPCELTDKDAENIYIKSYK